MSRFVLSVRFSAWRLIVAFDCFKYSHVIVSLNCARLFEVGLRGWRTERARVQLFRILAPCHALPHRPDQCVSQVASAVGVVFRLVGVFVVCLQNVSC